MIRDVKSDSLHFSLSLPIIPLSIYPSQSIYVSVIYSPFEESQDNGFITIETSIGVYTYEVHRFLSIHHRIGQRRRCHKPFSTEAPSVLNTAAQRHRLEWHLHHQPKGEQQVQTHSIPLLRIDKDVGEWYIHQRWAVQFEHWKLNQRVSYSFLHLKELCSVVHPGRRDLLFGNPHHPRHQGRFICRMPCWYQFIVH